MTVTELVDVLVEALAAYGLQPATGLSAAGPVIRVTVETDRHSQHFYLTVRQ